VSGEQAQLQEITRRYNAFYRKVEVPGSAMATPLTIPRFCT